MSADYTEGDGCLLGEPDSEDGYYLTRPESLLGGQVVRKNFASLYTDPFRTVTDRKAIARTLAGVQPGADQMERLKKAKQGYAVSLITKDGKATKIIIPSELQNLGGVVPSIKELLTDPKED